MAASRCSLGCPGCPAGVEVGAPHPRRVSDRRLATARAELQGALQALDDLAAVAEDERAYASSAHRRARVRYFWIVVGSRPMIWMLFMMMVLLLLEVLLVRRSGHQRAASQGTTTVERNPKQSGAWSDPWRRSAWWADCARTAPSDEEHATALRYPRRLLPIFHSDGFSRASRVGGRARRCKW